MLALAYTVSGIHPLMPMTTRNARYARTGEGLAAEWAAGQPAVVCAALSPMAGSPRRAGQVAFGLVALSTLGGWLLVLVHAQGP
jgi:hypothetical protein